MVRITCRPLKPGFWSLNLGDTFVFHGDLYMKTRVMHESCQYRVNCIKLNSGASYFLDPMEEVDVVDIDISIHNPCEGSHD